MPQEVEFIPTLKEAGHKKSRSVLIPGKTSGGIFVFPCFAQFLPHQQRSAGDRGHKSFHHPLLEGLAFTGR